MITKLDNKDIEMLESSVKNDVSKGALEEYLSARNKAETAWKVFRDSLVLSEALVEEENTKKEHKFKAGDKVRVLSAKYPLAYGEDFSVGNVGTVVGYKGKEIPWDSGTKDSRPVVVTDHSCNSWGHFEESVLRLVTEEEKTQNELRAEIIQRAKEFVEIIAGCGKARSAPTIDIGHEYYKNHYFDVEFHVKNNRVTVLVYLTNYTGKRIGHKPDLICRAKCHPDDVFNEHIGKAIALGRALGLDKDVLEFENAVQPTKVVQGQVIVWKSYVEDALYRIDNRKGNQFNATEVKTNEKYRNYEYREIEKYTNIVDDTNAQYSTSM